MIFASVHSNVALTPRIAGKQRERPMSADDLKKTIVNLMKQFDNQSDGADALIPMLRETVDAFKATGQALPAEVDRADKFLVSKAA